MFFSLETMRKNRKRTPSGIPLDEILKQKEELAVIW